MKPYIRALRAVSSWNKITHCSICLISIASLNCASREGGAWASTCALGNILHLKTGAFKQQSNSCKSCYIILPLDRIQLLPPPPPTPHTHTPVPNEPTYTKHPQRNICQATNLFSYRDAHLHYFFQPDGSKHHASEEGYSGRNGIAKRESSHQTHLAGECLGKQFDPRYRRHRLFGRKPRANKAQTLGGAARLRAASESPKSVGARLSFVHHQRGGLGQLAHVTDFSLCSRSLRQGGWVQKCHDRTDREQYTRSNAATARLLTLVKPAET